MLWEVDVYPADGQPDLIARDVLSAAADLHWPATLRVSAARGFLLQGDFSADEVERWARRLLCDPVVERAMAAPLGDPRLTRAPADRPLLVHVLPKPGVMDPVAQSAMQAINDLMGEANGRSGAGAADDRGAAAGSDCAGPRVEAVRTLKKYWIGGLAEADARQLAAKVLANDAIEQVIVGPLPFKRIEVGSAYRFELKTVPLCAMNDEQLMTLSRQGQLYLSLPEMQTIQAHFRRLGRDPTDIELETLAQTWSEHCSHKTLAGRIRYRDERGEQFFENMLRETIFAATEEIRRRLGDDDWCVSVFRDNAGVIRFDEQYNVCFKVETHNHPSALEPYGGANTGIGGVIRDPLGTGMGAKPLCNTDVFCFAPPDTPPETLPPGVLHPRRVMRGVVAGVRDYGNRMGIPTVNGAVYFDPRYLGNPLVYCGTVGLIPAEKSFKHPLPGDLIVAVGGRTGRDGIHGATFSSAELTSESEEISGGAVQIGNAITEKMLLDVILEARDRGLYHAITDCGAGGFSSAVGEMGEKIGAEVWLEKAPLKYEGLSYTEIWISEAQERMVLAVGEDQWPELSRLCASEGVEATVIGRFVPTGRLKLTYQGHVVGDLAMEFLHDGRPPVVREAVYQPPVVSPSVVAGASSRRELALDPAECLHRILGSLNVCSKHWVIRQYDHEVQGGSVVKPLVGACDDGPGDAAVIRPVLGSQRGLAIACGMNPRLGDLDPYWMAAAAIDEAVRNCVAVGADPARIAILDNFCWGATDRPETLGSLVRAALGCRDTAVALGTPFISGKDSLNNEFRPAGGAPISIPPSLLISAVGIVPDVARAVTMDFKAAGDAIYLVGITADEMGGSHLHLVARLDGDVSAAVPKHDAQAAKATFVAVHRAIVRGLVRACHDLSEGGLAAALAESAFSGMFGAAVDLQAVPRSPGLDDPLVVLFSESNSRMLCEVAPADEAAFAAELSAAGVPHARIGTVTAEKELTCSWAGRTVLRADVAALKQSWQRPLSW